MSTTSYRKFKSISFLLCVIVALLLLSGLVSSSVVNAQDGDDPPPTEEPTDPPPPTEEPTTPPPTEEPTDPPPTEEPTTPPPTEEPTTPPPTEEPTTPPPTEEPTTPPPTEEPTDPPPTEEPTTPAPTEEPTTEPIAPTLMLLSEQPYETLAGQPFEFVLGADDDNSVVTVSLNTMGTVGTVYNENITEPGQSRGGQFQFQFKAVYTPAEDFVGTDFFTVIVTDADGLTASQMLTVNVVAATEDVDEEPPVDETTPLTGDLSSITIPR